MSATLCVVLPCVGEDHALGRSPVQGILTKCLKGFVVSEVNSDSVKRESEANSPSFSPNREANF
jgi:hypothetical protein